MTKRTASELWDALDEATVDAELESALEKTPEENRRELVEAGYDLDQVHAKADAFFASLPAEAPPAPAPSPAEAPSAPTAPTAAAGPPAATAPPATPAPRVRRMRLAVVVPTALALAAGVALAIQASSPPVVTSPPPETPVEHAATLRREARHACESRSWKTCLDKLDEARVLDPSGNETPEVQSLRHAAAEGAGHP
jgi:hypothetical protein